MQGYPRSDSAIAQQAKSIFLSFRQAPGWRLLMRMFLHIDFPSIKIWRIRFWKVRNGRDMLNIQEALSFLFDACLGRRGVRRIRLLVELPDNVPHYRAMEFGHWLLYHYVVALTVKHRRAFFTTWLIRKWCMEQ